MWTDSFDPKQRAVWVNVRLFGPNGVARLRFVLDTGTPVTIVDTGAIDRLGYGARMGGKVSRLRAPGGGQAGYELEVSRLEAMGFSVAPCTVFCHDLEPDLNIDGLIGMDLLDGRVLTLDGRSGEISVGP